MDDGSLSRSAITALNQGVGLSNNPENPTQVRCAPSGLSNLFSARLSLNGGAA